MTENAKARELALELARELESELGSGVADSIQHGDATRAFGLSEVAAVAGLIMGAVQIVLQYLSDRRMATLDAYLEEHLSKPAKVSTEKRAMIIAKVLERFAASEKEAS